jgi:beta-N-acetylhexosaminidase
MDLLGTGLQPDEREMLRHPLVGGVILFARNFEAPQQLRELTGAIHALRSPPLLIAIDHEGGRVQRLHAGFTRIPPMRALGALYDESPGRAEDAAHALGTIIAHELLAHGVDMTFAPVLDIDYGGSSVIGDRAFHASPAAVARLAAKLVAGMREQGMGAVGKHFPGHGFVRADSHHEVPVDDRRYEEIAENDLLPYRLTIPAGLAAVMPAHVIYRAVDPMPAGFSKRWLQGVLREELGFGGMVFTDDLSMEGASVAGDIVDRARAAFSAGCDMALVCNAPQAAAKVLDHLGEATLDARRVALVRPHEGVLAARRGVEDYLVARRVAAQRLAA